MRLQTFKNRVYMCVCVYIYICFCVCTCVCIYIYIYRIYIHIYYKYITLQEIEVKEIMSSTYILFSSGHGNARPQRSKHIAAEPPLLLEDPLGHIFPQ